MILSPACAGYPSGLRSHEPSSTHNRTHLLARVVRKHWRIYEYDDRFEEENWRKEPPNDYQDTLPGWTGISPSAPHPTRNLEELHVALPKMRSMMDAKHEHVPAGRDGALA